MKIVIIEDERLTAEDLAETLQELDKSITIVAKILSVKSGMDYFKNNEMPDLIFSDIQLGDGLSFEIFETINLTIPVIFCTAYDEYALSAFNANGIAYLLKPFTSHSVEAALTKFRNITGYEQKSEVSYGQLNQLFESRNSGLPLTLLVHYKDKILPIKVQEIALFYLKDNIVHLTTFNKEKYIIRKTLDELEKITDTNFFRTNRQTLIHRDAIIDVSNHLGRKLWINLKVAKDESVTVSKEKAPLFFKWLEGI